uniref:acyl-ACP desaturase n=1 Tax=Sphingopyxis terrae TaxID=33052 RepID=UPI0036D2BA26
MGGRTGPPRLWKEQERAGRRPADGTRAVVAENINRHLGVARDWNPHDYVPWSQGRDFAFLGGQDWEPGDTAVAPAARASLIVNLLTEDNLPAYHHNLLTALGSDGAWGEWIYRWTAEEARHAMTLRDYLVVTRAVRSGGSGAAAHGPDGGGGPPTSPSRMLPNVVYTALQELATRLSHRKTPARPPAARSESSCWPASPPTRTCTCSSTSNLVGAALELAPDRTMRPSPTW